jgi:23S rRNA (guanine745-N1)-methyltransferase
MAAAGSSLACPLDGLPLTVEGPAACCAGGHSFDRAREGYFNLLGNQHKTSADPGDSKDMVQARTRTLDAGLYEPLAEALAGMVRDCVRPKTGPQSFHVADAGCGEGYYLDYIARMLQPDPAAFSGFDISKWAVRAACHRNRDIVWLVANNRYPPFLKGSIDLILCLFGFPVYEAFRAIQPLGGFLLLADPGPDHLIELRRLIYNEVRTSGPPALDTAIAQGYRLAGKESVIWRKDLHTAAIIDDLLRMTPHYFRMSREGRERLEGLSHISVTMDVRLRLLVKEPKEAG